MPTKLTQRNGRRLRADNLSVIVWDLQRVVFYGTVEAAQWIESVTQTREDAHSPWQDVEVKTQIYGRMSSRLHEMFPHSQLEFHVRFTHDGHEYSGTGVIKKRPTEFIQFYVDENLTKLS
ncbi:MAG: hypothetical protein P4L46_22145 [Fimbriimonas sp.]|nr:hypothetical protein [Fimbriimonas sp.]